MIHQCIHDAAKSPNVDLCVDFISLKEIKLFRCTIERCRDFFYLFRNSLPVDFVEFGIILPDSTASKITNLPIIVFSFEYVL